MKVTKIVCNLHVHFTSLLFCNNYFKYDTLKIVKLVLQKFHVIRYMCDGLPGGGGGGFHVPNKIFFVFRVP